MSSAKEKTAIQHARAAITAIYPGAISHEAKATGHRRYSAGEDLFGAFDFLILSQSNARVVGVQVKYGLHNVAKARTKISQLVIEPLRLYGPFVVAPFFDVWAWIPRLYFRCWRWDFLEGKWRELEPIKSPLFKPKLDPGADSR